MKKLIYIAFLGLFSMVFSQEEDKVNLNSPQNTIRTHLHFLKKKTYDIDKSAKVIQGYDTERAKELALKIKYIFSGRGLKVDLNKVPSDTNFKDSIQGKMIHRYVLFPERMPQIYLEKFGDKWYYSKHTLLQVNKIYDQVFPWYAQEVQKILPKFGNQDLLGIPIWKFIGLFILSLLSIILFYIFYKIAYLLLLRVQTLISKFVNVDTTHMFKKIARPISFLIIIKLLKIFIPILYLGLNFNEVVFFVVDLLAILFVVYIFLKIVEVIMTIYTYYAEKTTSKLDNQLIPILRYFLNSVVVILGGFKILSFLGINPLTIMAGLSIGGLAVALASQDTVKNFIGTIMIFVDKPFQIGDWISAGGAEGTVEKVGFRSTILRAPDTSIYHISNSKLAEVVVNNKGLLKHRRYKTELGLRYDTPPELVEAFVKGLRKIIEKHPGTLNDKYNVEFIGFGDSALLILLNVYFEDTSWANEQSSKHSLHLAILKFANAIGVGFAFPSTTVMVEQFPNTQNDFPKYTATQEDVDKFLDNIKFD